MVTHSYKGWYYWSAVKLVVGAPTAEATNGGVSVAEAIIIVRYRLCYGDFAKAAIAKEATIGCR